MIHFVNVVYALLLVGFMVISIFSPWGQTACAIVMIGWAVTQVIVNGISSLEELIKKYRLPVAAAI